MQPTQYSFEDLYHELEEIVRRLEAGDLPLADSLALFERGAALTEQCNAVLDQAELRVRQLVVRASGDAEAEGNGGTEGNSGTEVIEIRQGFEDWQSKA